MAKKNPMAPAEPTEEEIELFERAPAREKAAGWDNCPVCMQWRDPKDPAHELLLGHQVAARVKSHRGQ